MRNTLLIILAVLSASCSSQVNTAETGTEQHISRQQGASQIDEYVVETFQDSKGNLWFGTLEKGVARYDGDRLTYLTTGDGLPSNRVVSIVEDSFGNLWFGTGAGLSKYDGKGFTNYGKGDGLCDDRISVLLIDSKGKCWIGTWGGVCTFDGTQFAAFPLPEPDVETPINPDTRDWISTIVEDAQGNIWFGRDGFGACKFDGKAFDHLTTRAGLNSNNVQAIVHDDAGTLWIGTRVAERDNPDPNLRSGKGGLNRIDGERVTQFPTIQGLSGNDVYGLYDNSAGHLWISTIDHGVYRFAGDAFTHYDVPKPTMCFVEDRKGNIWLGCAGGLYRIDPGGEVLNVTTGGPWP